MYRLQGHSWPAGKRSIYGNSPGGFQRTAHIFKIKALCGTQLVAREIVGKNLLEEGSDFKTKGRIYMNVVPEVSLGPTLIPLNSDLRILVDLRNSHFTRSDVTATVTSQSESETNICHLCVAQSVDFQ